jgi:hypothetical protein
VVLSITMYKYLVFIVACIIVKWQFDMSWTATFYVTKSTVLYYHYKCKLLHTLPWQPTKVRFKVQWQNRFWNIQTQTFKPNLVIVMIMRSYWKLVEIILVESKHLQPCAKEIELGMKTFLCTNFVISLLNELYDYKHYV